MTDLSHLKTADEVHRESYENDPEYAAEYDRTYVANQVAIAVLKFRLDKGWSQTALAAELGMHQPAIARLEAGEHTPNTETLQRLAMAGILAVHFEPSGTSVRSLVGAS